MFILKVIITLGILLLPLRLLAQDGDVVSPYYVIYRSEAIFPLDPLTLELTNSGLSAGMATSAPRDQHQLALAPGGQWLAVVWMDSRQDAFLEVRNLTDGGVHTKILPKTETRYAINWSPDSLRLVVQSLSLTEKALIYDLPSQQLIAIPADYALGLQWLSDGRRFTFIGPSVCGSLCGSDNDVYLGEYADHEVVIRPLTQLNVDLLGLAERVSKNRLGFGFPVYAPEHGRFYVRLSEVGEPTGSFLMLYSFGFGGDLRFEADFAALSRENGEALQVQRLEFNAEDGFLYAATFAEKSPSNLYNARISIVRFKPEQGLEQIYSYDFASDGDDARFLTAFTLSPGGRYLGIGLSGSAQAGQGNLIVIDLTKDSEVAPQDSVVIRMPPEMPI